MANEIRKRLGLAGIALALTASPILVNASNTLNPGNLLNPMNPASPLNPLHNIKNSYSTNGDNKTSDTNGTYYLIGLGGAIMLGIGAGIFFGRKI